MRLFAKERPMTPSWDLLTPSINLLRKNVSQVIYLSLLPSFLLTLGLLLVPSDLHSHVGAREITGFAVVAVALVWSLLVYPGFLLFVARVSQGEQMTTMEAFKGGLPRLLPLIGMSIVAGALVSIGIVLLIIPGLILFRAFFLAPYYLVDQKLGPIESLKKSMADSKPVSGWIWGVIGVTIVLSFAGVFIGIIPILGTIASIVITYLYIFGPGLRYAEVIGKRVMPATED